MGEGRTESKAKEKTENIHSEKTYISEENNFSCKWRKARTYQIFSFPEVDVYKCEKLKDS